MRARRLILGEGGQRHFINCIRRFGLGVTETIEVMNI